MKFFFPDSQDQIDPAFDFVTEERSVHRVRQRDDLYAHEVLDGTPYDGMLISKPIVDGTMQGSGRYTIAQRHRIYRSGVHRFLRLDRPDGRRLEAMGDCGAFSYVRDDLPPYTPDEVIDFYEDCGFDLGFSVDHVILAFSDGADDSLFGEELVDPAWGERQKITLELAAEFLHRHRERRSTFTPIGVAQGWSPQSYAYAVAELQRIGYDRIALGGMVPLKTHQILSSLAAIDDNRDSRTQLHLLGVTRTEHLAQFTGYGVTSFDSTSPFRRAFKDDRANYWTAERTYVAIRVPQVDGNPKMKRLVKAGQIDQGVALTLERESLSALFAYDVGEGSLADALDAVLRYAELYEPGKDRRTTYSEFLEAQPWKHCTCGICSDVGINVAIFRGTERNKRRGFHNIHVFNQQLQREIEKLNGTPSNA